MPSLSSDNRIPSCDVYASLSKEVEGVDWESSRDVGVVLRCMKFALNMGDFMDGHIDIHQRTKYADCC